jgi:hypothetical protein
MRSGVTPECSIAKVFPVRQNPVWISSVPISAVALPWQRPSYPLPEVSHVGRTDVGGLEDMREEPEHSRY